jgi:branched-chain amino acid transport system permease protein
MNLGNTIIQGALLGGLYALFAAGLSLMFGVMRIVNIAHGDFIVLAAYVALVIVQTLGVHPFVSMPLVAIVMFCVGYALQRGLLNLTVGGDILPPLLVTLGLSVIIQNLLLEVFSADTRRLHAGWIETASFSLGHGVAVGWLPVIIFAVAIVVIAVLEFLLYRTTLGRAFRSISDDGEIARLYGVPYKHIFAVATGIALAVASIASVLMAIRTTFDPTTGPSRLLYAFEVVIVGGLGSLWGTLAGGVIIGVAQALASSIDPGWEPLAAHVVFLVVLIFRPRGLFPKTALT